MIYTDFVARLTSALTINPTEPNFVIYLPEIIQDAEAMCYRELEPLAMQKQQTSTLVIGQASLTGPSDWLIGQELWITVGTVKQRVVQRDASFMVDYAPDSSVAARGVPKYWCEINFQQLAVAPAPDAAYPVLFYYTAQQVALSASNSTTYLTQWLPDLFFAAAMVCATGYMKNFGAQADDPKMALSWRGMYEAALSSAKNNEGRRDAEGVFASSPSPSPSSAT